MQCEYLCDNQNTVFKYIVFIIWLHQNCEPPKVAGHTYNDFIKIASFTIIMNILFWLYWNCELLKVVSQTKDNTYMFFWFYQNCKLCNYNKHPILILYQNRKHTNKQMHKCMANRGGYTVDCWCVFFAAVSQTAPSCLDLLPYCWPSSWQRSTTQHSERGKLMRSWQQEQVEGHTLGVQTQTASPQREAPWAFAVHHEEGGTW